MLKPISNPLGEEAEQESVDLTNFVERMVPFYAQCLIEVSIIVSYLFFFPLVLNVVLVSTILFVFTLPSSLRLY